MTYVLGTSAQAVREAPLLLVDLETEEGVTGHAYQFCYLPAAAPAIASAEAVLRTVRAIASSRSTLWETLQAFHADRRAGNRAHGDGDVRRRVLGRAGHRVGRAAGNVSWAETRGGARLQQQRAGVDGRPRAVADEAEKLLAGGFRALKLRLGYPTRKATSPRCARCASVSRRHRSDGRLQPGVDRRGGDPRGRMLDGEEGCTGSRSPYAMTITRARRGAGSEDTRADRREFSQVHDMELALAARACDYVMPDLERIGGVTGWQRAARWPAARDSRCPRTCILKSARICSR